STEKVKRDYLTEEELRLLEDAPLKINSMKDHHRNMYVFSAYAGGLRISDVILLRWQNFNGTHIIVYTRKTSNVVSIKLPSEALEIINKYWRDGLKHEDFIFPALKNDEDYSDKKKLYNAISSASVYTN